MIILHILRALYGLSWAILFGAFVLMFVVPLPEVTLVIVCLAFYYLAAYWVLRGLGRLCGYGRPTTPEVLAPEPPVLIRRVIFEEVTPYDEAQPQRRIVREDVTLDNERTDHAG